MESETCCKFKEEKETYEESIVVESNEIPKIVNRQCGVGKITGIESRISDGDTAQYGEMKKQKTKTLLTSNKNKFSFQPNFHG